MTTEKPGNEEAIWKLLGDLLPMTSKLTVEELNKFTDLLILKNEVIQKLKAELSEVRQSAATIASENACKMVEIKKLKEQLRVKDEMIKDFSDLVIPGTTNHVDAFEDVLYQNKKLKEALLFIKKTWSGIFKEDQDNLFPESITKDYKEIRRLFKSALMGEK